METRNATVFFAETRNDSKEALLQSIQTFRGRLIKTIGTTYLCLFDDPQAACEAALKLKKADNPIPFRIGIARGQISVTQSDVYGDVVNLAARLQGIAKNQEIYASESVCEAVDRFLIPFRSIGTRQFSGLTQPVKVFAIETSVSAVQAPQASETDSVQNSEPIPTKERFDFSRVDQERIQEEEMIRAAHIDKGPSTDFIPLAKESTKPLPLKQDRRAAASAPRTNPEFYMEQKKQKQKKKAILFLVTLSGVLPVLVLGSIWTYYKVIVPATRAPESHAQEKIKSSEVLQAINRPPSERRRARGIQDPTFGSLLIKTEPAGAQVYINEKLVSDRTPVKIKRVPAQTPIQLRVSKAGFEDTTQLLNISSDENREMLLNLKKK